jgi:BolA protein
MRAKLTEAFRPQRLDIIDDSARHEGHVGARPEGESHFRLLIVADGFVDRSRIERQRMIYGVLGDLLASDIHALSIQALTPEEALAKGLDDGAVAPAGGPKG